MDKKELLEKLEISSEEELSDEQTDELIINKFTELNEHITTLQAEKDALSNDKQELSTSVEGYKSREETLSKELDEVKHKLSNTEGKLDQVTSMYKEQFSKEPEKEEVKPESSINSFDILQALAEKV